MTIEGFAWSVGAGLAGPIFNFGKDKSRVKIEKARTEQSLYRYQNVVLNAFREVSDALVEIQTYRVQLVALKSQVKAAENANRLSKLRYDQGFFQLSRGARLRTCPIFSSARSISSHPGILQFLCKTLQSTWRRMDIATRNCRERKHRSTRNPLGIRFLKQPTYSIHFQLC
jgi:hypothetical protein